MKPAAEQLKLRSNQSRQHIIVNNLPGVLRVHSARKCRQISTFSAAFRVTIEGLWLDITSMITPYSRDEAIRTVYVCAAALFPRHFREAGLLE